MNSRIRERVKSVALVVLSLLTLVLVILSWSASMDWNNVPSDNWLGRALLRAGLGQSDVRTGQSTLAAIRPCAIALRDEEGLYGVSGGSALTEAQQAVLPLLRQAAQSIGTWRAVEEDAWQQALRQENMVLLSYSDPLPFCLIAGNWGVTSDETRAVSALVLTGEQQLYFRGEEGFYSASCRLEEWTLEESAAALTPNGASLALERQLTSVRPETVLLRGDVMLDRAQGAVPDFFSGESGDNLQQLLEAFSYDLYTVNPYQEGENHVYVATYSTLTLGADGQVVFSASDLRDGIEAYQDLDLPQSEKMDLCAQRASTILSAMVESIGGGEFALTDVLWQGDDCTLRFGRTLGGVSVDSGVPFAALRFQDGVLTWAQVQLEKIAYTESRERLIPAPLAAASVAPGQDARMLSMQYVRRESGEYVPVWRSDESE